MTTLDLFNELELTAVGVAIRDSLWLFPVIEAGHLLGLTLLGCAVLGVDLHLLGFGLRERSTPYVIDQMRPWFLVALGLMILTGVPLFLSEAVKCYWSEAFWLKMRILPIAIFYTLAVRHWIVAIERQGRELGPWLARGIATLSITLWLTVAAAGRWIGFS